MQNNVKSKKYVIFVSYYNRLITVKSTMMYNEQKR